MTSYHIVPAQAIVGRFQKEICVGTLLATFLASDFLSKRKRKKPKRTGSRSVVGGSSGATSGVVTSKHKTPSSTEAASRHKNPSSAETRDPDEAAASSNTQQHQRSAAPSSSSTQEQQHPAAVSQDLDQQMQPAEDDGGQGVSMLILIVSVVKVLTVCFGSFFQGEPCSLAAKEFHDLLQGPTGEALLNVRLTEFRDGNECESILKNK